MRHSWKGVLLVSKSRIVFVSTIELFNLYLCLSFSSVLVDAEFVHILLGD